MTLLIRPFAAIALGLALTGCATNPAAPAIQSVSAPAGYSVPAKAYNKAIDEQGVDYYCGTGLCDSAPALISAAAPRYPQSAMREGRTGLASVTFYIEATGQISDLQLESATHRDFGRAALKAISTWQYRPATLKGEPVKIGPVRQEIPFHFGR